MKNDKHVCFLQGPAGYFFWHFAQALKKQGAEVTRINVCSGDRINWLGPAIDYRGSLDAWEHFVEDVFIKNGITDLVLLGEQRLYQRIAVVVARRLNITINVFELGYLRPDWLTFELDGMSGDSRFPKDPQQIMSLGQGLPEPSLKEVYHNSFLREAIADVCFHLANMILRFWFPNYQSHLLSPGLFVDIGVGLHILRTKLRKKRTNAKVRGIIRSKQPYFVFPLQIENDFQIRAYSPYDSIGDAITQVMTSFAQHAPPNSLLVIKEHPKEQLWRNWEKHCNAMMEALGLTGRVIHLDGGFMERLIEKSQGVITINSTTGVQAILQGKPVKVLGQSIYDIDGLSHQDLLDTFWLHPAQPQSELRDAFINLLGSTIQVKGGLYSSTGRKAAINVMLERLLTGKMNEPLMPKEGLPNEAPSV